jgi:hypothetical protein
MGLDANLFTRGGADAKPRGESLVQRHMDKLQQEKEDLALTKLAALMPQVRHPPLDLRACMRWCCRKLLL